MRRPLPPSCRSLVLSACGGQSGDAVFQGYVEGDFVDVAPEVGGRIVERAGRARRRGRRPATCSSASTTRRRRPPSREAEAELARAEAQLANLQQGQRPPEIAVIEAQIAEAQASLDKARATSSASYRCSSEGHLRGAARPGARGDLRRGGAARRRRAAERRRGDAGAHAGDRGRRARRRGGARGARPGEDAAHQIRRRARRSPAASRTRITRWARSPRPARRCSRSSPTTAAS